MVGNTMIDTLVAMQPRISAIDAPGRLGLERGAYLVVTLHRPTLVDGPLLADAMEALLRVAEELAVVFPVHPRTRARSTRSASRLRPTAACCCSSRSATSSS